MTKLPYDQPDEHRPVEAQHVDDRGRRRRPRARRRCSSPARAAPRTCRGREIVGHEPELVGERALVLLRPAEVVLRPAVNEQDRRPITSAPLADVQPQAPTTSYRVNLHPPVRSCSSRATAVISRLLARRFESIVAIESRSASGRGPYLWRSPPYLRALGCFGALPRDTGRMEARAIDAVRRAPRRAGRARARSRRSTGRQRCGSSRRRRGGHRQDAPRLRAGEACP